MHILLEVCFKRPNTDFFVIFSSPDPPPDVEFLNPLYIQRHEDKSNVIKEEISDLETDTLNNKHLATTNADESETLLVQRHQHLAIDLETDRDIGEILC